MTLLEHPYLLGRVMLLTINVLPMILMFWLLAHLVDRFGTTDWGRIFVMAAATLGTMLTPFAVVLNNHIVAAVSATVALYCVVRSGDTDQPRYGTYALAGLAAAFTAANELPALALLVLVGFALWRRDRRTWRIAFLPAAAAVTIAFFATNYAAHESLRPPYMHRSASDPEDNWYQYTYTKNGKKRESYWQNRAGIDRGEPFRTTYTLHALLGHHGVFSLTPVWLLSVWGIWLWLRHGSIPQRQLAAGYRFVDSRLPGLLPGLAATNRPQLRWHDQWLPLDVLVRPTLVAGHDPQRGPPGTFPMGTSFWIVSAVVFGAFSQLPQLESLDPSLDLPLA